MHQFYLQHDRLWFCQRRDHIDNERHDRKQSDNVKKISRKSNKMSQHSRFIIQFIQISVYTFQKIFSPAKFRIRTEIFESRFNFETDVQIFKNHNERAT